MRQASKQASKRRKKKENALTQLARSQWESSKSAVSQASSAGGWLVQVHLLSVMKLYPQASISPLK